MQKLHLKSQYSVDHDNWIKLLEQEGIKSEKTIEEAFGIYVDDKLVATAARFRNIIKCVAIDSDYRGSSLFNELISSVYNEVVYAGYTTCYVYTKESTKNAFTHVGFKQIEHVDNKLYFMENAVNGFDQYLDELAKSKTNKKNVASVVMNANPFTKGHLYLITQASLENDVVHLFVLSEDVSDFSTEQRTMLVRKGTAHLKNVIIHPTSNYMVSAATFPSYFLKEDDDTTEIQARLDARIFKNHISPVLGLTIRYVGSEPFSFATNIYNSALQKEFNGSLKLKIIDRIGVEEEIISASKVRKLLSLGKIEEALKYVPPTTCEFLMSEEGKRVVSK